MNLSRRLTVVLLVFSAALLAQRRVDPRSSYHSVIAVLPPVGSGSHDDPIRPEYCACGKAERAARQGNFKT